jgi:hypothetical protein
MSERCLARGRMEPSWRAATASECFCCGVSQFPNELDAGKRAQLWPKQRQPASIINRHNQGNVLGPGFNDETCDAAVAPHKPKEEGICARAPSKTIPPNNDRIPGFGASIDSRKHIPTGILSNNRFPVPRSAAKSALISTPRRYCGIILLFRRFFPNSFYQVSAFSKYEWLHFLPTWVVLSADGLVGDSVGLSVRMHL